MSANLFQWILVIGVIAPCWLLLSLIGELRDLNQRLEHWGQLLSGTADEARAALTEVMADTSSISGDLTDIAKRTAEHFPTTDEIERVRSNEP